MKKYCFVVGVLAANVFGMHNDEVSSSKNSNNKRLIPYEQRFVQNKKHITSAEIFEKFSDNELKRSFSDDYAKYAKGWDKTDLFKASSLSLESKSHIIDTITQGYVHIIQVCYPNVSRDDLISLDAVLSKNFYNLKEQLIEANVISNGNDDVYSVDISSYAKEKGVIHKKIEEYTNAISKVLSISDTEKQKINEKIRDFCDERPRTSEMDNVIKGCEYILQKLKSPLSDLEYQLLHASILENLNEIDNRPDSRLNLGMNLSGMHIDTQWGMDSSIHRSLVMLRKADVYKPRSIPDVSHLKHVMKTYLNEVYKRSRYNREKTLKASNDVENFINEWINEPNTDDEVLVRRWLGEPKERTNPESFFRALFESVINS